MPNDVITKLMPAAKEMLSKNKGEMSLASFERVYGPAMTEALIKGRWAEVKEVRMVDTLNKVMPRLVKVIRLT